VVYVVQDTPSHSSGGGDVFDDNDYDDDDGGNGSSFGVVRTLPPPRGPRLDYLSGLPCHVGFSTTTNVALSLIDNYIDRFRVVLLAGIP
jgi:hypothetical protein